MSLDHNRIKVADLEKDLPNKILITNTEGELAFSDFNNQALDFQQVTDNGFVTENPFYRDHDLGEANGFYGVLDDVPTYPVLGIRSYSTGTPIEDYYQILGFMEENYSGNVYLSYQRREAGNDDAEGYDRNLLFSLPIKPNPSYPQYNKYTLATTDDLAGLSDDFVTLDTEQIITSEKRFTQDILFRGIDTESYVKIDDGGINFHENGHGSVKLKLGYPENAPENVIQKLQVKDGTIALLDDITLQKAIDNGNSASVDEGNSYINLFDGIVDNRENYFQLSNGEYTTYTQHTLYDFNIGSSYLTKSSFIYLNHNDGIELSHQDSVGLQTAFKLGIPASTSTFSLPSKSIDGDYILATSDDLESLSETFYNKSQTDTKLSDKVDKVTGKGLSTNDYTTAEKAKVAAIDQAVSTAEKAVWNAGDMSTNTNQTVSGIKTFLSGMFGLRNVANTFTSFFTNANTASRTYTLQDRSGTLADLTDIAAVNTGKMNTPSGTANYLSKFLTATTIGISRLWDNGTYFGIGTVNTPTKDFTLGNQGSREIGIEDSDSSTIGKGLTIVAGRTVNFQLTADFIDLNQTSKPNKKGHSAPNGDYYMGSGSSVYRQVGGTGNFIMHATLAFSVNSVAVSSTNDIYVSTTNGLYKQTNATGSFVLESGMTNRNYYSMSFHPDGHLYAICSFADRGFINYVYKRTNNTGDFTSETTTTGAYTDIACAPNGDVYATLWGVGLFKQSGGVGNWSNVYGNTTLGTVCVLANGTIYTCSVYGNNLPKFATSSNNGVSFANSTVNTPFGSTAYNYFGANGNNVYCYQWAGSSIFFQNNDALGIPNLEGGTLKLKAGTGKGTGQSKLEFYTGQKTVSGTNMQAETLRMQIDENGILKRIGTPVYADNTAALAGGLTAGMEYRTSTGAKYEVY